jgi:hypothetical protein
VRTPSAAELVRVWELGFDRAPWYRALLMLAPAYPDQSFERLAQLSLGERNVRLIGLRVLLFGANVEAAVACPRCATPLEFAFDLLDLCADAESPPEPRARTFVVGDGVRALRCRAATSTDLAAVADARPADARAALARRLVIEVIGDERAPDAGEVRDDAQRIGEALVDADPYAETSMAFDCAACGHEWNAPFDISAFLWSELTSQVHRILEDVQRLSKSYGWSEGSILAMTGLRRRFYLDRAS